jgi:hypothetical protein
MSIQADIVTLPAHWAIALVNNDFSGLGRVDERAVRCTIAELHQGGGWYVAGVRDDSERFTWRYEFYDKFSGAQGGMVCDYVVHRNED